MAGPFVLLPGTLCDARLFQHQVSFLKPHTLVDLRSPLTLEAMVDQVASIPLARFTVIGFSMGGHVAQEFALKYPQRVDRLVVIAASSEGYPERERKIVQNSLPLIEKGTFTGISDKRLREYLHPDSYAKPELRELIQSMAGPDAKDVYLRQIRATLDRRNLTAQMRALTVPTLFMGGEEDQIVPVASVQRSAANPPRARFIGIEDCGHFVPLEKPEAVNRALREFCFD